MSRKSTKIQLITAALVLIAIMNGTLLKAENYECNISVNGEQDAVTKWLINCADGPTNTAITLIRDPEGLFEAGRSSGNPHAGVDIKLKLESSNQCLNNRSYSADDLAVRAIADGKVAYSRLNIGLCPEKCPPDKNPVTDECPRECPPGRDPLSTTGYGLTVIIDHGNGIYSLYAHLAQDRKTIQCLPDAAVIKGETMPHKVGDNVKKGDIIGYIGQLDPELGKWDHGTGNATQTKDPAQVHFEIFHTEPGKISNVAISDIIDRSRRGGLNPTIFLRKVFEPKLSAPTGLKVVNQ